MFRCLVRSSRRLSLISQRHTRVQNIFKTYTPMTDLITHIPTSELSTCTPALRNQPVSKIENYDPTTYKTLAFYKFHDFTQPQLEELREKLLIDLGELGIVGRIYISK